MATFQSSATPPCAAFPERIGGLSLALAAMQLYVLPQLDLIFPTAPERDSVQKWLKYQIDQSRIQSRSELFLKQCKFQQPKISELESSWHYV